MLNLEIRPEAFTPREVGKLAVPPISERSIRRAIRLGELIPCEVGNRQYILREDFIAWCRSKGNQS
jgi:hypothetical protein